MENEVVDPPSSGREEKRLLLVDTNCFLRIYHSPLRPFLGTCVGEYEICTLVCLVDEVQASSRLSHEYAWVQEDLKNEAVQGVLPAATEAGAKDIADEIRTLKTYANRLLEKHCLGKGIKVRALSLRDLELLATAVYYGAVIATDEWPLAFVVDDLTVDEDDNYVIESITSLHVLHILEGDGRLTSDERRDTVRSWLRESEKLPRDWAAIYRELFKEAAPTIQ
jgi:hypothetical protein